MHNSAQYIDVFHASGSEYKAVPRAPALGPNKDTWGIFPGPLWWALQGVGAGFLAQEEEAVQMLQN